jgi:hypothetical protein
MIPGAFVSPTTIVGMTDTSTMRKPFTPRAQLQVHYGRSIAAHAVRADRMKLRFRATTNQVANDVVVGAVRAQIRIACNDAETRELTEDALRQAHARD